jgi:hypothetical protein
MGNFAAVSWLGGTLHGPRTPAYTGRVVATLPNREFTVIRAETEFTQVRRMELLQSDDGAAVAPARATFHQVR